MASASRTGAGRPGGEVLQVGVRLPGHDRLGLRGADAADGLQAEPDRRLRAPGGQRRGRGRPPVRLQGGARPADVDVHPAHPHAVPPDVRDQAERRVEAHRLVGQQGAGEGRREVVLEPGAGVHQVGEADRVALREAVVGEGLDLAVDVLGDLGRDSALGHPAQQPLAQPGDPLVRALGAHRLAQPVGLGGAEPGAVDGELHHLLLEQRHPEGLAERVLHQRVRAVGRFGAGPAAQVRVDGTALDRAGADQRDLDHQVVEVVRLEPGQGRHLGPGLDLEHADGVGPAQHRVHALVVVRDGGQVVAQSVVLGDQVAGVVQGGEHAATTTPMMNARIAGRWCRACAHCPRAAAMPSRTMFPVCALAKTPPWPTNVKASSAPPTTASSTPSRTECDVGRGACGAGFCTRRSGAGFRCGDVGSGKSRSSDRGARPRAVGLAFRTRKPDVRPDPSGGRRRSARSSAPGRPGGLQNAGWFRRRRGRGRSWSSGWIRGCPAWGRG